VNRRPKVRSIHAQAQWLGSVFLLPAALFILVTVVVPLGWNFALSATEWNGFTPMKTVWLDNFIHFFQDSPAQKAFLNSIRISLVSSAFALLFGMFLALLVYRLERRTSTVLRLIYFAPSMMPMIVIGLMFTFILTPDVGLVNQLLKLLGFESLQRAWLGEPRLVLWSLAVVSGWRGSGSVMILFYTAIIAIPSQMFEAAHIEGAGYLRQIRYIILPLIMPTIGLVSMLVMIGSFKTYDIVFSMTKGGPGNYSKTVPIQMLENAFKYNEFGYAAAIGVLFTLLVSIIIFVMNRLSKGEVHEY
jgi:raffinose/stachyose/melibiose transport system permease protein